MDSNRFIVQSSNDIPPVAISGLSLGLMICGHQSSSHRLVLASSDQPARSKFKRLLSISLRTQSFQARFMVECHVASGKDSRAKIYTLSIDPIMAAPIIWPSVGFSPQGTDVRGKTMIPAGNKDGESVLGEGFPPRYNVQRNLCWRTQVLLG